jgi:hypothetical protein
LPSRAASASSKSPVEIPLRGDNQGENTATNRMRLCRCWQGEGRA